jgi:hypothetical protein
MASDVRLTRSPVCVAGMVLTKISAVVFIVVFLSDLFGFHTNPYIGIVFFLVLPALFVLGLVLIPLGAWLERRRRAAGKSPSAVSWPAIDLNGPGIGPGPSSSLRSRWPTSSSSRLRRIAASNTWIRSRSAERSATGRCSRNLSRIRSGRTPTSNASTVTWALARPRSCRRNWAEHDVCSRSRAAGIRARLFPPPTNCRRQLKPASLPRLTYYWY